MPLKISEQFAFGGVDARSNPANFPPNKALRANNWEPQPSGALRLRRGFSNPTMGTGSTATGAIHSAIYYELLAGTQYILYGQGTSISRMALAGGATTFLGAMASANPWGFYRANGKIFWNDGVTGLQSYDGTTLRTAGIRPPSAGETASIVVSDSTAAGSFNTSNLTFGQPGYQLFMAYQNPNTGHVGNRVTIGARVTIGGGGHSIVATGLPSLAAVNAEWVKVLGRTNEGGQVPYWFTDANQTRITVSNTATSATFTSMNVDFNAELPTRNTVPPVGLKLFCKVLGRVFGATGSDLSVFYTEAEEDAVSGIYIGRPEESWPSDNAEAYPTAEIPTCLASYRFEGWFYSRNHLIRFSESLRQALSDPWQGPWPTGCAGQRAFVETPYGPFWVSGDKQIMTFGYFGPMPISEEYERALLAKIADANLSLTEIAWFRDPNLEIDRLEVLGFDANNNPVIVIHDFKLRDQTNVFFAPGEGQGYSRSYPTATLKTFVRQTEAQAFVKDSAGHIRLWAGDTAGAFHQLEDGNSDSGATYTADYVGLLSTGLHEPRIVAVSWFGDNNVAVSHRAHADKGLADFVSDNTEVLDASDFLNEAKIGDQGSLMYLRFLLTAHPADGTFDLSEPPSVPVNPYGAILGIRLKEGAERPEGRR